LTFDDDSAIVSICRTNLWFYSSSVRQKYQYTLITFKGINVATSKTGGSTQNGRDSHSKRLGVKLFDGHKVFGGEIIVRQRGTRIHPGKSVGIGSDDTLFVKAEGQIKFHYGPKGRRYVSVIPTLQ
jgi:large subunit ribosomal protein L27